MRVIPGVAFVFVLLAGIGRSDGATIEFFKEQVGPFAPLAPASDPNSPLAAEAAFLAAVTGEGTEHFDSLAHGTHVDPLNLTFGATGITAQLSDATDCAAFGDPTLCGKVVNATDDPIGGRRAISDFQYYLADNGFEFGITFNQALTAFGFFGTDVGDVSGKVTVTAYRNNLALTDFFGTGITTKTIPTTTPSGVSGNVFYYGFYITDPSLAFDQLFFGNVGGHFNDVFGFDDMTAAADASPVPEPASLLLLGTGLVGAGVRRWKKRKA